MACTVGDWVQVQCDYSPGICSEGGTGVVIAKGEGKHPPPISLYISLSNLCKCWLTQDLSPLSIYTDLQQSHLAVTPSLGLRYPAALKLA